jgi:hypothetical protein
MRRVDREVDLHGHTDRHDDRQRSDDSSQPDHLLGLSAALGLMLLDACL